MINHHNIETGCTTEQPTPVVEHQTYIRALLFATSSSTARDVRTPAITRSTRGVPKGRILTHTQVIAEYEEMGSKNKITEEASGAAKAAARVAARW